VKEEEKLIIEEQVAGDYQSIISNQLEYSLKKIAKNAVYLYLFILIVLALLFPSSLITSEGFLFGIFSVFFFFKLSPKLTLKWGCLTEKQFLKKIFWLSFSIRLIWVFFSYYYFTWMTGQPFEYSAADSLGYHGEVNWIISLYNSNMLGYYFANHLKAWSDNGFLIYLFPLYYIFGDNILIPRIVNSFLGALTVILVYKLAKRNFGENTAKIAAIFSMLMPSLVFYCGLHLKEVVMTFLLVFFIERADRIILKSSKNIIIFLEAIILLFCLFGFRTVLAVAALLSMFLHISLSKNSLLSNPKKILLLSVSVFLCFWMISSNLEKELMKYYSDRNSNLSQRMDHYADEKKKSGGNSLAKYGKFSVFAPIIFIAPFPTVVDTKQEKFGMLNGALFIRNILAFFCLLGLFVLFKRKLLRRHVILIAILILYLLILAKSGFALSERFHYPILPFLLIFAAYGVSVFKTNYMKYYNLYLCLVFLLIVGWNVFKLAGRGLIN